MKDMHPIDWEELRDLLHDEAIKFDGCDSAVIGIDDRGYLCYSYELLIDVFVTRDEMQYDEAVEWVDYNILPLSAYGKFTIVYTDY
jgi:hypothetical protein